MASSEATDSVSAHSAWSEEAVTLVHELQHQLRSFRRKVRTLKNQVTGLIWPGSLLNLGMSVGGVAAIRLGDFSLTKPLHQRLVSLEELLPLPDGIPEEVNTACACALTGLVVFAMSTLCRRILLKWLFTYRGWMYEPPGKQSTTTLMWGVLVRVLAGWRPTLYSYQKSLPRMPVPPLRQTMGDLMDSLEPVFADQPEKLKEFKEEAEKFEKTIGPKLQRALTLRSWWAENFVSDWWEKYVYLMGRSPLPINSNYYIMGQGYWTPTTRQSARAAGYLYQMLKVREEILAEELEPLVIRKTIPVCMAQYKRAFSTTRVPGEEIDTLVNYSPSDSQHVVVNRRGLLYKVDITDSYGHLLSPRILESHMEWIIQDADSRYKDIPESERLVPTLTSLDRTSWAKARKSFFSSGLNKETLDCIESAVVFLVLDTNSFPDLSSRASYLLHGSPGAFWFDKSIELIIMSDAHVGLNCEHSFADAPVVAHIVEFNYTYDVISKLYDDAGHCIDIHPLFMPTKLRGKPLPLQWEVNSQLEDVISRAYSAHTKNIQDLDLVLCDHITFGKGAIKKCKLSPDAFIQMALHSTYRKLTGVPALTYEASMTRLYKHGRTETVRSLTKEADAFVRAFLDSSRSTDEKRQLLKTACERHAIMYKDAMNGKGLDRHLFALYVASKGLGIEADFLKNVLSIPWTLSTSQQPQQQIQWSPDCSDPMFKDMLCPGGGFGPVADDGYGVSYMVAGDHRVFFHVSSRHSAPATDSAQFLEVLKETLKEMIALHQV